jgi:integration host factor subunit beta
MTRSDLIETLAQEKNITAKRAEQVVGEIFDAMSDALMNDDRIEIRGFGSFMVKEYGSYKGRNPKTGEIIEVKPKKLPFFKVGKELRERVFGSHA